MAELSRLTEYQLKKRIQQTQAELTRRVAISKAAKDIIKILQKHNLTVDDVDLQQELSAFSGKSKKRVASKPAKQKRVGAKVAPKFKSLDSLQKWSGRGKTPNWVVALCEKEKLTVEAFKKDPRFRI